MLDKSIIAIDRLIGLYRRGVGALTAALDPWLLGLLARLTFAAVLFGYYWASALTKVGDGFFGFFTIAPGAYFQMIPPVVEAAGYDPSQVAFFPWQIIVFVGTYSEFLFPILIIAGLFTRIAALGMIGFTLVQSYVDINFHGADAATVGALFDRTATSLILDQRAFWMFIFIYLAIKGPGLLSLDALFGKLWKRFSAPYTGNVLPEPAVIPATPERQPAGSLTS